MKYFIVLGLLVLTSCSSVQEVGKDVWGSTTRHIENARESSIYKSFPCSYHDCYEAIKELAGEKSYHIFQERPKQGLIVLMNIENAIDTTEVGVFLTPISGSETEVEISSLSAPAKRTLAKSLYTYLDDVFVTRRVEVNGVSN